MARINISDIERVDKERNNIHEEARASYTSFVVNGQKYFQIDTYGRPYRDMPGKISQSIQFDRDSAMQLIKLLEQEF